MDSIKRKEKIIREFCPGDIECLYRIKGVLNDLTTMLAAPTRFKYENADASWFSPYTGNLEDVIRALAENEEGVVIAVFVLSGIDFEKKTALFSITPLNLLLNKEAREIIRLFFGWASVRLGLDVLFCNDHVYNALEGKLENGDIKNDFTSVKSRYVNAANYADDYLKDSIVVSLPDYCVGYVINPNEKRHILQFFDNEMFHPLSQNSDGERVISRVIAAADILVAYNSELLGYIAFYANDAASQVAYITSIAVRRKAQGKGIGHHLIYRCMNLAKSRGMQTLSLKVHKDNEKAICFYRSLEFQVDDMEANGDICMHIDLVSKKA